MSACIFTDEMRKELNDELAALPGVRVLDGVALIREYHEDPNVTRYIVRHEDEREPEVLKVFASANAHSGRWAK